MNSTVLDTDSIGMLIDRYSERYPPCHVAVDEDGEEPSPPMDMRVARLSSPGWVQCKTLRSTLSSEEVASLEAEFGVELPPVFKSYLTARFHLFDQLHATRFENQLVFWTPIPSRDPLGPLRRSLNAWRILIKAEYIPIAEWGDGWGPMCLDSNRRSTDRDCPVVWMDHELLFRIAIEKCGVRANVEPLAQPLYDSTADLLIDLFTIPQEEAGNT